VERVTLTDRRTIAAQIGREPRGLSGIARRCSYGFPQVVRVHPVVEGKPFPTLYWLTCPWLCGAIDRLEAAGRIAELEERLSTDLDMARRLDAANDAYVADRSGLLSRAEVDDLRARGFLESLTERGIGGIAGLRGIKCLHLHVAHELAQGNPIGELVLREIVARECSPDETICSTLGRVEQIRQINR
jgi:hypothetical protein